MPRGLVYGFGINDVDYLVRTRVELPRINGKRSQKITWTCPYFIKWKEMLKRCYSEPHLRKHPTYIGCSVHESWRKLSDFIKWVNSQPEKDWFNKELDKDLLIEGNKLYSQNTCVFISRQLNVFIVDRSSGKHMVGVDWKENIRKFQARCRDPFLKKDDYLGVFSNELDGHLAWKAKKHEHACKFAELETDPRIIQVLTTKYLHIS